MSVSLRPGPARCRRAALLAVTAFATAALVTRPALAHPGHAAHASGTGWFAPLAVCAGVAIGVGAVGLRTEGVVSARAAAAGGALGAAWFAVGVGAFAGLV